MVSMSCDKHHCEAAVVVFNRWEQYRRDLYSSNMSELIRNRNRDETYMISA